MPTGGYKTSLKFPALGQDFITTMMILHEYATDVMPNNVTRFPTLTYRRRTTPDTALEDRLHMEVIPANREWTDYKFPIYVEAQPKRQELSAFGIDEPRDLLIHIALPVLEEQGLISQQNAKEVIGGAEVDIVPNTKDGGPLLFLVNLGDRVFFQGYQYDILTLHEDQFWANTEIPTWLVGSCSKSRLNVPADVTLDDSTDDWRDDPLNPDHSLP